jgi:hypothetical protein
MEQRKDSRISQSMRKKEQNIKNETEKSSRIRRRCVKRMPGSGGQKNGAEKRFQDQAVAAERRTSGSGGQKNGAEKRFQNQAVDAQKEQTLKTMWLHQKMHFVHPQECGHTLYSLRIKHHYKSLANFMSCIIANIN